MTHCLFIISIISVYLMKWFKHLSERILITTMADAVKLFMWEVDVTNTIPTHKTEIRSSKKNTIPFILTGIPIAKSQK